MKKVLFFLVIFSLIISCSHDDTDVINNPETIQQKTTLEDLSLQVKQLVKANNGITLEQIKNTISSSTNVMSSVVEDSILYITMNDSMQLQVDLYGLTTPSEFVEDIDNSEIDSIVSEIESALEINESKYEIRKKNNALLSRNLNAATIKSTSASNKSRVITNRNVLFWAPNGAHPQEMLKEMQDFVNKNGLILTPRIGDDCKINDITNFSNYGLVVIENHGNVNGQLLMPTTEYWLKLLEENKSNKAKKNGKDNGISGKLLRFDSNRKAVYESILLTPHFSNLSKTIIWACVCNAYHDKSEILKAAYKADVAGFGGSPYEICYSRSMLFLNRIGVSFYNSGKGGADLKQAYGDYSDYSYNFTDSKGTTYRGVCYLYVPSNTNVFFQKPSANKPYDNRPIGELNLPAYMNPYNKNRIKSYSQVVTPSQIEAGFLYINKANGEQTFIPFSADDRIRTATWKNLITRYLIIGNTDNLEKGDYSYKTYLKLGNEVLYSNQYDITIKDNSLCPNNNHPHAIDMGAAGVWACCNVGASKPEDYGGYYAWGEIATKSGYDESNYKYGDYKELTKYCTDSYYGLNGFTDGKTELELDDDVAHKLWGGHWRIPSKGQFQELIFYTTSQWVTVNGKSGRLFTASNGNSIFLPAAGCRLLTSLCVAGSEGDYWSRSLVAGNAYIAYFLGFGSDYLSVYYIDGNRASGHTVRPVRP